MAEKMTRARLNEIIERDMPGWHLAQDEKDPDGSIDGEYIVRASRDNGSLKKTVVISNGKIIGAQG